MKLLCDEIAICILHYLLMSNRAFVYPFPVRWLSTTHPSPLTVKLRFFLRSYCNPFGICTVIEHALSRRWAMQKPHRAIDMPVQCFYSGVVVFLLLLLLFCCLLISLRCVVWCWCPWILYMENVGTFGSKQYEQIYYEIKNINIFICI